MAFEGASMPAWPKFPAIQIAASGITSPVLYFFYIKGAVVIPAYQRQTLASRSILPSKSVPDAGPQLVAISASLESIVNISEDIKSSTGTTDCDDHATSVLEKADRRLLARVRTSNHGEDDYVVFFTLVRVYGAYPELRPYERPMPSEIA